jgi:hypothetical protein
LKFQAQVDVIEGHRELILVKATNCFELVLRDNQTRSGHCRNKMRYMGHFKIAGFVGGQKTVSMASRFSYPNDHSRMLDASVIV